MYRKCRHSTIDGAVATNILPTTPSKRSAQDYVNRRALDTLQVNTLTGTHVCGGPRATRAALAITKIPSERVVAGQGVLAAPEQ